MFSPKSAQQALRNEVTSNIYSRGVGYFRAGKVKKWSTEEDGTNGTIIVTGAVRGAELYEVVLTYDPLENVFTALDCSCPYEASCKHAVALGLAFADSLLGDHPKTPRIRETTAVEITPHAQNEPNTETLYKALRELGLAVDQMPDNLIQQLLEYQKQSAPPSPSRLSQPSSANTVPTTPRNRAPFNPKEYFVALTKYREYIPTFHEKNRPAQETSLTKVLGRSDLAAAQRELLTYINDGKFGHLGSPPPDPEKLFPLLVAADFPVHKNSYGYGYTSRQLTIELRPAPLAAEIVYQPAPMHADRDRVRHDFFLRMPQAYWKNRDAWYGTSFSAHGSSIVHDKDAVIEVYRLTPMLAGIIARVTPFNGYDYIARAPKTTLYQTRLTGEEIARFDELAADASRVLTLTSPLPPFHSQPAPHLPQPALVVHFAAADQTLRVVPVLDYGIYRQDISESIYLRRRGNKKDLSHRESYEHPGTHIVTVADTTVHHAKIDTKKECALYRTLARKAPDLGLTKTLKCNKRGSRQVAEYMHTFWPKLSAYAEKQGYPIFFERDILARAQTTFRADFNADSNTETDWLSFDVACYCGDERVTLERLRTYIESGEPFWRTENGTLVEIANRQELERLVRLLQSFHARENGGFEGRLHHATELEYVMTSSPHYNAVRAKSFRKFLHRMQSGTSVKKVRLPTRLAKVLRPYQKAGIAWLYFLRSYRFAGILADDMGLGKTLQALAVLSQEKISGMPSLVVCPKTLLYNWKAEAQKFFPELSVLVYEGSADERRALQETIVRHDLVVISYSTLKQDEEMLAGSTVRFNYAILDEAQFIKNHATKNAQAVKKLNADYRLALTGTPMENNVSELWSLYDFLMPGFFGAYEHFAKHFHRPIMDTGDRDALEHLRRKVAPFMLRRTKAEVLPELPQKIEQTSNCRLSEAQNILYQQILAKVRGEIFQAVEKKGFKKAQIHILAGLTKLRQVCNHPALLIKDKNFRTYESAKLDMCMELVDEVMAGKRKVLIFSQFTQMLDIVSASLADKNVPHLYLSGKTKDRQDLVNRFNTDPDLPVFLISMKAGGTGLNLPAADTVIIFDPWWNPSVENQAIDRAHRIGQTKTVNVYRLLTIGTIEEKIQALKNKKARLFNALIGESKDLFKKLTWDDVRNLFAD